MPGDFRIVVIVSFCKGRWEKPEFRNYRDTSFVSVVVKVYDGVLVDKVSRLIDELIISKGVSD